MFEIKKFNSGEYDVKLIERINNNQVTVNWNWFKEPDVMIPLMKIDAIRRQYGTNIAIDLKANYFPYSRQDRVFEIGGSLPLENLIYIFCSVYALCKIKVMGFHSCYNEQIYNDRVDLKKIIGYKNLVFPDVNAKKHFLNNIINYTTPFDNIIDYTTPFDNIINCTKTRNNEGIICGLDLTNYNNTNSKKFIICDDICDGGRTFIECAKSLKAEFGNEIQIDLLIYHAFMTHGLDEIKKHINLITIINPDSYEYVCDKFPNDKDYFRLGDFNV